MNRRQFTRICSSMVVAAGSGQLAHRVAAAETGYTRSLLFLDRHTPLKASELQVGQPYLFFYPYVTTPSFLIDLGPENTAADNGVGPQQSIVAFSAICSHKMTHPAREISFINYRHDEIEFYSRAGKTEKRAGLISCCSERSVYDPAAGAEVLGGPAPQPLASIRLEYDPATDALTAVASAGTDMYEKFFAKFGFRAALEHKVKDVRAKSADTVLVHSVDDYSRQTIKC